MKRYPAPRPAFTLIELLVVISVIAVLIALLLPALGKSRDASRTTYCLANLRSIGQGLTSYADTNRDTCPHWSAWQLWDGDGTGGDSPGPGWTELLRDYVSPREAFHDPARPRDLAPFCYFMQARYTYAQFGQTYTSLHPAKVQFPSAFVFAGDCDNPMLYAAPYGTTNNQPDCDQDDADHPAVFFDGELFAHKARSDGAAGLVNLLLMDDHATSFNRYEPALLTWHGTRFSDWAGAL
jgi:prepilin-type N-terminal cleavage/methylation domain-containing protein